MRTKLLALVSVTVLLAFAGSALAWTYKYECDFFPLDMGWRLRSGSVLWMELVTDPDNPANSLLNIYSPDKPDPWPETLPDVDLNRPQIRLETLPDAWTAISTVGTTFEIRFKQLAGGIYMEPIDGMYQCSFETVASAVGIGGEEHVIAFLDAGQYGQLVGPYVDFTDWTVFRGTMIDNGDGTHAAYVYIDGFEIFSLDDIEEGPIAPENNYFRWGHSGGSGPPEEEFADIWIDYIYLDTGGVYPPGVPTTGETAVETSSWGKIKSQF